jgi:HK97 family phage prohead protease
MHIERRSSPEKFNVRQSLTGEIVIEGYASVFGQKSRLITEDGKTFYEIINRNAFNEVLQDVELNVIANRDHDDTKILARTKSGTLSLSTDTYGLKYTFTVPNTTLGKDTAELLNRGDLSESSFKYYVRPSDIVWSRDVDGTLVREIMKVSKLRDVSIVIDGAFANTDVGVTERDLQECEDNFCQLERKKEELDKYYNNLKNGFYGT